MQRDICEQYLMSFFCLPAMHLLKHMSSCFDLEHNNHIMEVVRDILLSIG